MKKVTLGILLFASLCLVYGCDSISSQNLYVNDVLRNPSRYYNTMVEIEGDVTGVTPGTTTITSGTYKLTDELGSEIQVHTRELPALGKHFVVKGVVSEDVTTSIPYLRELKRGGNFLTIGLIAAIVVFVGLVVALILIAFLPRKTSAVKEQEQVAEPEQEAPSPQPKRIPTVKHEESKRQPTQEYLGIDASLTIIDGPSDVNT